MNNKEKAIKYVQERMKECGVSISDLINNENAPEAIARLVQIGALPANTHSIH